MKYVHIQLNTNSSNGLDGVFEVLCNAVGIMVFEERESDNYADGRYYIFQHNGLNCTLALADDDFCLDLPYWVSVSADQMAIIEIEARVESLVKDQLLPAGFRVARIENFGLVDQVRIDY